MARQTAAGRSVREQPATISTSRSSRAKPAAEAAALPAGVEEIEIHSVSEPPVTVPGPPGIEVWPVEDRGAERLSGLPYGSSPSRRAEAIPDRRPIHRSRLRGNPGDPSSAAGFSGNRRAGPPAVTLCRSSVPSPEVGSRAQPLQRRPDAGMRDDEPGQSGSSDVARTRSPR